PRLRTTSAPAHPRLALMAVITLRGSKGASAPFEILHLRGSDASWLVGAAAVLTILCGLPYLLSTFFGPAHLERIGTFWFMRDFSQYEAAMREGASQAGWLIHDPFSAEPHAPALLYPLPVGAGKLVALTGLSNFAVFAALEWLGRLDIFGAVYGFLASF